MPPAQSLTELAREYAIEGQARWEEGPGGLSVLVVATRACTARVFVHGGHVAAWQPSGGASVLFMSPRSGFASGRAIRGGAPVCFPWFGAKHDDPSAPGHGFARTRPWQVAAVHLDGDEVVVALALRDDADTRRWFPHAFELRHVIRLGHELTMTLEYSVDSPTEVEAALHTYFDVGDIGHVAIRGLSGTRYIDKVAGGEERRQDAEPLVFTCETDRVFLDTEAAVIIDDPDLARRILIEKSGSLATVVWNPWQAKSEALVDLGSEVWRRFVCVETANVRPSPVALAAGTTHRMSARISIEPSSRLPPPDRDTV